MTLEITLPLGVMAMISSCSRKRTVQPPSCTRRWWNQHSSIDVHDLVPASSRLVVDVVDVDEDALTTAGEAAPLVAEARRSA